MGNWQDAWIYIHAVTSHILSSVYWFCVYRLVPKHQYHRICIKSLAPGYHDPNVRMVHGCFGLFTEWFSYNVFETRKMNKEYMDNIDPAMWDDLMRLYTWWRIEVPGHILGITIIEDYDTIEATMFACLMKYRKNMQHI